MIPVELVLLLLDELRAKGVAMIETPAGRDSFYLGEIHGWVKCAAEMRDRISEIIEDNRDRDPSFRSISSSGNNDDYEF